MSSESNLENLVKPEPVEEIIPAKIQVIDFLNTSEQLTQAEANVVNTIVEGKKIKEEIEKDIVQPIGLYKDLSPEDYTFAIEEARKNLLERDDFNEIKNLERDLLTVPDQNFCVVSWVGPTFKAKTDISGFRIMGAFKTLEKAQKYAQRINHVEPTYDIGVMEMNLWCLGYPDESDVIFGKDGEMDIKAMEQQRDRILNEFIINHKVHLEESKQVFEVRKRAIRKSKITKEGDEKDAPLKEVPTGVPTDEMAAIHDKEMEKWIGVKETKIIEDDNYELTSKILDFDCIHKLPNQEYAVVSFIGYSGKNNRIPICIKGIYATEIEAQNRIKQLIYIDDTYDMVPMPLYKWVPCDPDLSLIRQEFKNKNLNNLLEADEKQKEETLSFHQIRKKYVKPDDKYGVESEKGTSGDKEFEYKLNPAKITFKEPLIEEEKEEESKTVESKTVIFKTEEDNGEITNATNTLVDVEKYDSEDIRMRGRLYYQNGENEVSEEELINTYSFNVTDKDIKEPMFKKADDAIKELEEKIQNLMATEGITEKEARDRFRLKFIKREEKINQEDIIPIIPKSKPKGTDFERMSEKIDDLKKKGHTAAEIRKIMSEEPKEE